MIRALMAGLLLSGAVRAQELLWEVFSLTDAYTAISTFGDLDRDGCADLLAYCWPNWATSSFPNIRILSGRDGAVLHQHVPYYGRPHNFVGVGDFDGDGHPDYALASADPTTIYVEVWSPHRSQSLLVVSRARGSGGFGLYIIGDLDVNGDGLPDLVIGSVHSSDNNAYVYDHSGALLYIVPVRALGGFGVAGIAIGDVTGDGCDDFLISGSEPGGQNHGFIATISGRTGGVVRVVFGEQPGDFIGYPLCAVGDIDRDGKTDYATSNYWGSGRGVLTFYSGATGAILRHWTSNSLLFADRMIGGHDVDLDGVPDVIGSQIGGPGGRVRAFSSRDAQILVQTQPRGGSISPWYGRTLADLGVQPGNPYPVFALTEMPTPPGSVYQRIEAWRCSPLGTTVAGSACSSGSANPSIGLRPVGVGTGLSSRIVLGSAPPGSLAWCLVAPASASTFGGATLPLALDPLGFQGCQLFVPPLLTATHVVGSGGPDFGYAQVDLGTPLLPSGGSVWAAQWLVLDPLAMRHAATMRHEFRVR